MISVSLSQTDTLIARFAGFLGRCQGNPELVVDRWPDKENRTEREIDAVAGDFAMIADDYGQGKHYHIVIAKCKTLMCRIPSGMVH